MVASPLRKKESRTGHHRAPAELGGNASSRWAVVHASGKRPSVPRCCHRWIYAACARRIPSSDPQGRAGDPRLAHQPASMDDLRGRASVPLVVATLPLANWSNPDTTGLPAEPTAGDTVRPSRPGARSELCSASAQIEAKAEKATRSPGRQPVVWCCEEGRTLSMLPASQA